MKCWALHLLGRALLAPSLPSGCYCCWRSFASHFSVHCGPFGDENHEPVQTQGGDWGRSESQASVFGSRVCWKLHESHQEQACSALLGGLVPAKFLKKWLSKIDNNLFIADYWVEHATEFHLQSMSCEAARWSSPQLLLKSASPSPRSICNAECTRQRNPGWTFHPDRGKRDALWIPCHRKL